MAGEVAPSKKKPRKPRAPGELLEIPDVADKLGLSVSWVQKAVAAGTIPYLRIGRAIRFDPAKLEQWIAAHAHVA